MRNIVDSAYILFSNTVLFVFRRARLFLRWFFLFPSFPLHSLRQSYAVFCQVWFYRALTFLNAAWLRVLCAYFVESKQKKLDHVLEVSVRQM